MASSPQILVFDSGVGALSIIAEIRERLPGASITYASDNAFFPYGSKSEEELIQRVDRVLRALVKRTRPDIIVVACNTASTVTLPSIRAHFTMPIVGVVPAIKPAAKLSRSRVIGLLATPGTIARPYTEQLIRDFAADCRVIRVGSGRLVELAEQKLRGSDPEPTELREALSTLFESPDYGEMDTVVLACTHFPLLRDDLSALLGQDLQWVDSGEAIARRVQALLAAGVGSVADREARYCSLFTAHTAEVEALTDALAQRLPGPVDFVSVGAEA